MEVFTFLICLLNSFLLFFIFYEIEKVLDNSFETGKQVQSLNRRLIRKGKR